MNKKGKNRLLLFLLAAMLCFIWGNSLMPASVSSDFSNLIRDIINFTVGLTGNDGMIGTGRLRKIAHATEFAVLGALVAVLAIRQRTSAVYLKYFSGSRGRIRLVCIVALCGLAAAFIDETIQLTSPGRSAQISDVCIDFCGYSAGALLAVWVYRIRRGRRDVSAGMHGKTQVPERNAEERRQPDGTGAGERGAKEAGDRQAAGKDQR